MYVLKLCKLHLESPFFGARVNTKNIKKHQDKIVEIMDKLAIQNLKDKFPNQLAVATRCR